MIVKIQKGATVHMFDSLDTPGGHIVVWLAVMGLSFVFYHLGLSMEGKELQTAALVGIGYAMKGFGSLGGASNQPPATPTTPEPGTAAGKP